MKDIDLLIIPQWIVPVVPAGAVYEDCAIAIKDTRIEGIFPVAECDKLYNARETIKLDDQALIPGLVNTHGHSAMSLLRGYADDLPLSTWLNEHIWPAEGQWISDDFVRDGTKLAFADMLHSGTTFINDMYFFPEIVADVALQSGLRTRVSFPIIEFPSAWGQGPDDYISKGIALYDQYKNHPLVSVAFGPHAPYTVSDKTLERVAMLSEELDAPIHIHLHETAKEVEDELTQSGKRPVARLNEIGILGPRTEAVHMTQVSDEDLEMISLTNTSVIHCPKSNMKLASGICPVSNLQEADVNVGLGTDSAASNNGLNMLEEMRFASLLSKVSTGDATALSAQRSLEIATLGGAKSLGIDAEIGSLETGKQADMVSIPIDNLSSAPIYNVISQIVYAIPTQAQNVWVAGKQLLKNGALQTLNSAEIRAKAHEWQTKIAG